MSCALRRPVCPRAARSNRKKSRHSGHRPRSSCPLTTGSSDVGRRLRRPRQPRPYRHPRVTDGPIWLPCGNTRRGRARPHSWPEVHVQTENRAKRRCARPPNGTLVCGLKPGGTRATERPTTPHAKRTGEDPRITPGDSVARPGPGESGSRHRVRCRRARGGGEPHARLAEDMRRRMTPSLETFGAKGVFR